MDLKRIRAKGLEKLFNNDDSKIYIEKAVLKQKRTLVDDFRDKVNYEDFILIDILSPEEFAKRKLEQSENIPYESEGRFRENFFAKYKYRESIDIIIVAAGNENVQSAISQIMQLEYRINVRVKVLKGGI